MATTMPAASNPIPTDDHWSERLARGPGANGRIKPNLDNCMTALEYAPEWRGLLSFNEFSHSIWLRGMPPDPWPRERVNHIWDEGDDLRIQRWFQMHEIDAAPQTAADAVRAVAREHAINPLLDYLNNLTWDRWPRIDNCANGNRPWLSHYLGVECTDYSVAVGRAWLISAVARAFMPGCKVDCCLILEGPQGIGKSSALRALAGDTFFSDSMTEDLGGKEASILCEGVWIIEFSELEGILSRPSKMETVKAFLSRAEDRYRPHYSRYTIRVPRQCVFAATTNRGNYMPDVTGNRRFWPVECQGRLDVAGLERDRDQIWAEAVHLFRDQGEQWHLEGYFEALARKEQSNRAEVDPWFDEIDSYLECRTDTSVREVLIDALGMINPKDWTQREENRAAKCLRTAGWEQYRVSGSGKRRYRPKGGQTRHLRGMTVPVTPEKHSSLLKSTT